MDANMEPWALHVMRYKRWDVRPCDFANLRRSDDQAVFAAAWRLKRLLITHDSDFLDDRLFPFANCSGLLVLPTYDSVSMQYANLLAGACEFVSKGARLWFHTKIVARRDFTVKVRNWEKSHGHIAEWQYRIAPGYRKAASENSWGAARKIGHRRELADPTSPTFGNMRANGVRSLDVCCWQCHHPGDLERR
jgi:predicted nuclease of predicted toxin-antitoxin system